MVKAVFSGLREFDWHSISTLKIIVDVNVRLHSFSLMMMFDLICLILNFGSRQLYLILMETLQQVVYVLRIVVKLRIVVLEKLLPGFIKSKITQNLGLLMQLILT